MKLEEHAARAWPILVSAALNRQTMTYEMLGEQIKVQPQGLGEILAHLMYYCVDHRLPPLTVLVVGKNSGKPGQGLLTTTDTDREREDVYRFAWIDQPAPRATELLPFATRNRVVASPSTSP